MGTFHWPVLYLKHRRSTFHCVAYITITYVTGTLFWFLLYTGYNVRKKTNTPFILEIYSTAEKETISHVNIKTETTGDVTRFSPGQLEAFLMKLKQYRHQCKDLCKCTLEEISLCLHIWLSLSLVHSAFLHQHQGYWWPFVEACVAG